MACLPGPRATSRPGSARRQVPPPGRGPGPSVVTGDENLDFFSSIYRLKGAERAERKEWAIALTHIAPYRSRLAGQLSGGWKQRLALAAALMHRPRVLFLDEPTAGIDPVARRELWDLLFGLAGEGVTMFVTTHYMDEAERCGTVAYLYLSRLIVNGHPEQLKQLPDVTPSGMRRVEVECREGVASLMTSARTLPYVRASTIFGTSLHLLVDESVSNQKIDQDLEAFGVSSVAVRDIAPTLEDVFVRDRQTGTTVRVSVATNGDEGDAASYTPSLSADGRRQPPSPGEVELIRPEDAPRPRRAPAPHVRCRGGRIRPRPAAKGADDRGGSASRAAEQPRPAGDLRPDLRLPRDAPDRAARAHGADAARPGQRLVVEVDRFRHIVLQEAGLVRSEARQ